MLRSKVRVPVGVKSTEMFTKKKLVPTALRWAKTLSYGVTSKSKLGGTWLQMAALQHNMHNIKSKQVQGARFLAWRQGMGDPGG